MTVDRYIVEKQRYTIHIVRLCVKSHADQYCSTFKYILLEYVIYTSINMH